MIVPRAARVRVVIVEDSIVQRANLVEVLEADGDIEVVGQASTAREAIALVASARPDVVTLDLNIPDGGGQYALEQIMADTPTPVLVLSSSVRDGSSAPAVEALVGGALIAMPKPMRWTPTFGHELRASVRTARRVPVVRHPRKRSLRPPEAAVTTLAPTPHPSTTHPSTTPASHRASQGTVTSLARTFAARGPGACVVAIAASTGGPAALATVFGGLAAVDVPVLVVQHIHPDFVQGLVDWMARVSPIPVTLARHGQPLRDGCVHIAPGGAHLRIGRDRRVELADRPAANHRPSADQLFESVAAHAGRSGIGVILTGMGEDGAAGLAAMHARGARTIGQDEATSAVYGMPRAARRLGAVDQELALPDIAPAIVRAVRTRAAAS